MSSSIMIAEAVVFIAGETDVRLMDAEEASYWTPSFGTDAKAKAKESAWWEKAKDHGLVNRLNTLAMLVVRGRDCVDHAMAPHWREASFAAKADKEPPGLGEEAVLWLHAFLQKYEVNPRRVVWAGDGCRVLQKTLFLHAFRSGLLVYPGKVSLELLYGADNFDSDKMLNPSGAGMPSVSTRSAVFDTLADHPNLFSEYCEAMLGGGKGYAFEENRYLLQCLADYALFAKAGIVPWDPGLLENFQELVGWKTAGDSSGQGSSKKKRK